jgi:hypothetical protein
MRKKCDGQKQTKTKQQKEKKLFVDKENECGAQASLPCR